jgi:hypothetical protein
MSSSKYNFFIIRNTFVIIKLSEFRWFEKLLIMPYGLSCLINGSRKDVFNLIKLPILALKVGCGLAVAYLQGCEICGNHRQLSKESNMATGHGPRFSFLHCFSCLLVTHVFPPFTEHS